MKKSILIIFLLSLLFAGDWLDVQPDARSQSLGGADISTLGNAWAALSNPACLTGNSQLSFASFKQIEDVQFSYAGFQMVLFNGYIGAVYIDNGDFGFKNTSYTGGQPVISGADFGFNNRAFFLSWAAPLFSNKNYNIQVNWGVTYKVINQRIADYSAWGQGADLALAGSIGNALKIGLVQYNAISPSFLWNSSGQAESMTKRTKIGMGYFINNSLLIVSAYELDGYRYNKLSIGIEYSIVNTLFLRLGGYHNSISNDGVNNQNNITVGVGIKIYGLELDCAYEPANIESLGDTFKFSIDYLL
ncbi:MAG: hypothetical protein PHV30_02000 [Candidatus Margulisbacteria bacterium]|nr:hypothetical protein [Candidatus Margulisiibacteriota bacterium]